ncbi:MULTISPECIES: peptidoglycan-binding domain-containing protein [Variovorax]|jgi:N-acetylmuramoyl-L-alanine amidase|uniref:peptidoglycan-binding domain-containing protein n=1 Tax=Variovorax TaxID=34072 RepID=UPI001223E530|nr:peptidoglycan-binding domain-containing protein [Variovorax sp.]TAJ60415.1 MAG: peptidoglycan-binding protein [Variovorax sp.]
MSYLIQMMDSQLALLHHRRPERSTDLHATPDHRSTGLFINHAKGEEMATGKDLLKLAEKRIGDKYENVLVPKDNSKWTGPWDCAEFASWVVFQITGELYGCTDNRGNPATTEAYSGSWVRDAENGTLTPVTKAVANSTPGVILVRRPPMPKQMGHVAISDGNGGTVEAAGKGLGVKRGKVEGRIWHFYAQIPGVQYSANNVNVTPKPLPFILTLQSPNMSGPLVKAVQRALKQAGFDPGAIDGEYGPHTVAAVHAYQKQNRLVADGDTGPLTARKLGIAWPA